MHLRSTATLLLRGKLPFARRPLLVIHHATDFKFQSLIYFTISVSSSALPEGADYFGGFAQEFSEYTFPPSAYVSFFGLDDTSLFGTAMSMNDNYAVVGASGYGEFILSITCFMLLLVF